MSDNANAIALIDEQPASMPTSGLGEDFHKLSHFFSPIVLVATSAVENEVTHKKRAPNASVADLNDTEMTLRVDEASNTRIRFARSAVQQVVREGEAGRTEVEVKPKSQTPSPT